MTEALKEFYGFAKGPFYSKHEKGIRGIYALDDIKAGKVLFSHELTGASSSLICLETVLTSSPLKKSNDTASNFLQLKVESLNEFKTVFPEHHFAFLGTAFALLIERISFNLTGKSQFSVYLEWLPAHSEGFCRSSKQILDEISGSSLYLETCKFQRFSRKTFEDIFNGQKLPLFFNFLRAANVSKDTLWSIFNDNASIVQAYSFSVEIEDEVRVFMVPLMDAFNADETKNNVLLFDSIDENSLKLEAITQVDIDKDTQIFNSFGEMTAIDRFIKYGYIDSTDEHTTSFKLGSIINNSSEDLITFYLEDIDDINETENIEHTLLSKLCIGSEFDGSIKSILVHLLKSRIIRLHELISQNSIKGNIFDVINGELKFCKEFLRALTPPSSR